jgi:hypothetical protein
MFLGKLTVLLDNSRKMIGKNQHFMKYLKMKSAFLFLISLLFATSLFAQDTLVIDAALPESEFHVAINPRDSSKVIKIGNGSNSTIIALVDQEIIKDPSLIFNERQLTTQNTSVYLFMNTISLVKLYAELNHLTRSNAIGLNKNALQLVIIGTDNELERYQSLDLNYFSTHYFVSLDNSKAKQPFTTIKKADWKCDVYLENIKGKYLWFIDKEKIKSPKDSLKKHEVGRLTLGYTPVINIGFKNNNLGNYFSNGLSLDYSISKNIQLYTSGSFAIKSPKIEDEIESQIRSQIDISDIINGTATEQELTLSVPIESQLYTSVSLGLRYLFTPEKDFSFYVSTELSSNISTKISGQLDTTLTLVFNGSTSNNFSSDNIEDEAIGLVQREAANINSGIGAGFQYELGGKWRFDLSINYSTSIRIIRASDTFNNNALKIAVGLNYRFKDKKEYAKIYFY